MDKADSMPATLCRREIYLEDQAFAVDGGGHAMDHAGIDEKKFSLLYGKDLFFTGDKIKVFNGHNDFDGSMPVIGISFKSRIAVQSEAFDILIDHGFFDAV